MATTGRVRVVVNESAIERLTAPGGMVYRHATEVRDTTLQIMRSIVPVRSGALKASIRNGGALKSGRNEMQARINIGAKHARFVLEGTYGPITADSSRAVWVRTRDGGWRRGQPMLFLRNATRTRVIGRAYSVRGQQPNDFAQRALAQAMRQHGH